MRTLLLWVRKYILKDMLLSWWKNLITKVILRVVELTESHDWLGRTPVLLSGDPGFKFRPDDQLSFQEISSIVQPPVTSTSLPIICSLIILQFWKYGILQIFGDGRNKSKPDSGGNEEIELG
jgi:hypothetical protein